MCDAPVGSTIDTWESAAVITASDGKFDIRITPRQLPKEFLSATSDYLNFDLRVISADDLASWSWTLFPLSTGGLWRTEGSGAGDSVARADFDLGRDPSIVLTDSVGQQEKHELLVGKLRALRPGT